MKNLKSQTSRGKFLGKMRVALNMKKHLFCMLASALIVSMSLISCKQPVDKIDNNLDLDIFAVDISRETDWNYIVVGKDGSSMFIDVDESNDIPTRLFLKPDKDSDDGFTIFFKENGLPDKMVANGYIVYYGNFNGYRFDLAIIYPNNTIEYHFDIETDINWDAYSNMSRSVQARSISSIFNSIRIFLTPVLPVVTCGIAVYYPNPLTLKVCASSVVGIAGALGKLVVENVFDGFTEDVGKAFVDVMACAGGNFFSCLSGLAGSASLLSYVDFNLTTEKTTQINEAIRRIDGDVLTEIPRELLELFYDLGITINSGRNPPNIEGTYSIPTLTLMRNTTSTGIAEQWDKYVTFSGQNDNRLTVNVDYTLPSENGPFSLSGLGYIVGNGSKYTIIVDGIREEEGYTAKTVEAFSGEITSTGISAYQWAVFMIDNSGDPLGHWISNGTGYSKRGTAVKFDPNQPGLVHNPIPLTADIWTTGSISSTGLNEIWYSFNVVSGTSYSIWWSDSYEGNGHTLDIVASAQYENGTSIFSGTDSAYYTPRIFIANQTSIVKIRVSPYYSGGTGTYALTYSIGSTAIRPSALITTFSERTLSVNHVQGIKEASSKTVPSGARN